MGKTLTYPGYMTAAQVIGNSDVGDLSDNGNGTIDATNIKVSDVKLALGTSTNSLVSLVQNNNINKFALFKPGKLDVSSEEFVYIKEQAPYELADFAGYNHNAIIPFITASGKDIEIGVEQTSGSESADIQINVGEYDWLNTDFDNGNLYNYLYVEIFRADGTSYATKLQQIVTSGTILQTITTPALTYNVTPGTTGTSYYALCYFSTDTPLGADEKVKIPGDNRADIRIFYNAAYIRDIILVQPGGAGGPYSIETQNESVSSTGWKNWTMEVRFRDNGNNIVETVNNELWASYTDVNDNARNERIAHDVVVTGPNYVQISYLSVGADPLSYNVKPGSPIDFTWQNMVFI